MQTTHDLRAFVNVISEGVIGRCYMNQVLLKDLPNSQENQSLQRATLLKRRVQHRRFPVNLKQFLRTPFLQNTSGQLLSQFYFQFILAFKQEVAGQWTAMLYLTYIYIYKSVHKFKKHHGTPCNVAGKCVFMQSNSWFTCCAKYIFQMHNFLCTCNHVQQQLLTHISKKFINFIGNTCSGKFFLMPNFPTLLKRDCSTGVLDDCLDDCFFMFG